MKIKDLTIPFVLIFFFLWPSNFILHVACLIYLLYLSKNTPQREKRFFKLTQPLVAWMILSFIFNMFFIGEGLIKESFRIVCLVMILLLFPFKIKCRDDLLIISLLFVIGFVFLTQIAFVYIIPSVINFVDVYYPYDGDMVGLTTESLESRASGSLTELSSRLSGIYRNPNQCGRFVLLCMSTLLIINKRAIVSVAVIAVVAISVMLTGSRTAFIIYALITGLWLYRTETLQKKYKVGALCILMPFVIYKISTVIDFDTLRVFQLSDESDDYGSLTTKYIWLWDYIKNEDNFLFYIIGHGTTLSLAKYGVPLLDSEIGMAFFSFGFIGLFLYLRLIIKIISYNHKLNLDYISFIFMWGITSTILFSFRMSILYYMILSLLYSQRNTEVKCMN